MCCLLTEHSAVPHYSKVMLQDKDLSRACYSTQVALTDLSVNEDWLGKAGIAECMLKARFTDRLLRAGT